MNEHEINNQDWDQVTFKKKLTKKEKETTKEKRFDGCKNTNRPNGMNMRKLDETTDAEAHKKVSHNLRMQIQQARLGKQMTQKELANRCNLDVKTIQQYESGTAIPNPAVLNKLRRVLGPLKK